MRGEGVVGRDGGGGWSNWGQRKGEILFPLFAVLCPPLIQGP